MAGSDLTAGEKAYLESGGQDATALLEENPGSAASSDAGSGALNGEVPPPIAPAAPAAPASTVTEPAASVVPEAPEPGEEEVPTADGKGKRRMVDSRALKEARTRAKTAEEQLAQFRDNYTRVDERLKMLTAVVEQPDPAPVAAAEDDTPIDPEQDLIGAYNQLVKKVQKIETSATEQRAQTEGERQTEAVKTTYRQDANAFRAKTPDFNEAYNFLLAKRGEQLKALGYGDQEVSTYLYNEEMNLAQRAISMRQSPAQQLYALSQSMGYVKAAPVAPAPAAPAAQVAAPAAPAVPQVPSVTAEIDRIKAGQLGSRSLSTGGGAAGEELSLETLANMPQKEFEKFMDIPGNREKVERAMGRRAA